MEISANTQAIAYLISAILFILALKGLTHPASARRGNYLAMVGMVIAIAATLMGSEVKSYGFIIVAVAIGAVIGSVVAAKVQMTAMPQLVAALHSFVGMAAVLVAIGTYLNHAVAGTLNPVMMGELSAGIIIGAITFSGSVVAFAKLQGLVSGAPVKFAGQHALNAALAIAAVGFAIHFGMTESLTSLVIMTILAFVLGFTLIIPIGGADMPVIISMLNSYSGWAAAATGFTLGNNLLIIVGALVGFSGAILSYIMCRAMNRSIINVVFGGFGSESGGEVSAVGQAAQKGVKSASVDDAVYWMEDANRVIDNGSERVTTIVRRLRSFARLDEADLKTVDIHEGLEDTLTLIHHEIKHNLSVIKNFGDIPPVACYPGRLNQVYLNLLINAKQAIKENGEITITTSQKKGNVQIEFKDNGNGIPKDKLKKVFDPGYTTKGVGVGTGLGLSIVYQIIEDHKGTITVDSEVGRGTTFTIIFPMNLDELLEKT